MPSSDDPAGLFSGQGSGPRATPRRRRGPTVEGLASTRGGDTTGHSTGHSIGAGIFEPPIGTVAGKLLRRYARRRSVPLRNQIVELHREIVEAMARSLALRLPPSVDPQDLVHAGMWGLMQAIDKFDVERCVEFTAFMRIRVRGAMLDELRHMDYLPRLYRRRIRDREQAMAHLRIELARDPSEAELAQELGVSLEQLHRGYADRAVMQTAGQIEGAGDDPDDGFDSMDRLADDDSESPLESISRQDLLAKIQSSLEPVEWRVLQLHYFEGMSGKEVARRLRLSASRICQIHGRVLDRLKQRLQPAV